MTEKVVLGDGDLLRRLLSSSVKAELLTLFHRNPGLIDTADGVAMRIGRKGETIKPDITDLVSLGTLTRESVGKLQVYYLNRDRDKQIQEQVAGYLKSIKESLRNDGRDQRSRRSK